MTTEEDFQRTLDANPTDWQTRLVFADWLEEQGDARADGYRALGLGNLRASRLIDDWWYDRASEYGPTPSRPAWAKLPADWYAELVKQAVRLGRRNAGTSGGCCWLRGRREAEDAAALAFAELPTERRAELLAGTEPLGSRQP